MMKRSPRAYVAKKKKHIRKKLAEKLYITYDWKSRIEYSIFDRFSFEKLISDACDISSRTSRSRSRPPSRLSLRSIVIARSRDIHKSKVFRDETLINWSDPAHTLPTRVCSWRELLSSVRLTWPVVSCGRRGGLAACVCVRANYFFYPSPSPSLSLTALVTFPLHFWLCLSNHIYISLSSTFVFSQRTWDYFFPLLTLPNRKSNDRVYFTT